MTFPNPSKTDEVIFDIVLRTGQTVGNLLTAASAATTYDEKVRLLTQTIKEFSATTGQSVEKSASLLSRLGNQFELLGNQSQQIFAGALKEVQTELQGVSTESQKTEGFLSNLGQAFQVAFGIGTIQLIRRVIREIEELAERGIEVSRSFFNMAVGVRALQRTGLDITFAETTEQVKKLRNEFKFFSEREIREGISQVLLLTRNVELSKEEIFEFSEAIAKLAIITGKDFGEAGFFAARAVTSGFTEALQRAGIAASRLEIEEEGVRQGINKAFLAMTQQERASVTLALVFRQLAATSDDVAKFQETLAGSIASSEATMKDTSDFLGRAFLPLLEIWKKALVSLSQIITILVIKSLEAWIDNIARVGIAWEFVRLSIENAKNGFNLSLSEMVEKSKEAGDQIRENLRQRFFAPQTIGEDVTPDEFGSFPVPPDRTRINEINDDILKEEEDFQNRFEDSRRRFNERLQDIEIKRRQREFDENLDFNNDLAKLDRQAADRRQDAEEKYRDNELRAERDFQEKLLRLREKFLFDLEDALRERDAVQILRLIRRFNLERRQLERQKDQDKQARKDRFDAELKDIEEQRARRIRELQIEHQIRLEEIQRQYQRERVQAMLNHQRQLSDLILQRNQRLAVLRSELQAELEILAQYEIERQKLRRNFLRQIRGGREPLPNDPTYLVPGYQHGGEFIARQPTVIGVGEGSVPELVKITPINQTTNNNFGMGETSRLRIELLLSRGLEAEIVDRSLAQVADVIFERLR